MTSLTRTVYAVNRMTGEIQSVFVKKGASKVERNAGFTKWCESYISYCTIITRIGDTWFRMLRRQHTWRVLPKPYPKAIHMMELCGVV